MQVDVYPTDAEAFEAAAALVAERLRAAARAGRATAALGGGRAARGLLVALAAHGDVPWDRVEWCLADERCGDPRDPLAHARIVRDSLFGPRGIAAARIHEPPLDAGTPDLVAARYAETLATVAGTPVVFDVVALPLGADGALGSIPAAGPGSVVLAVPGDPPRVALAPDVVAAARAVVIVATGRGTAPAVARTLRDGAGAAAVALPSERVSWVLDRDAAAELLADARPVEER